MKVMRFSFLLPTIILCVLLIMSCQDNASRELDYCAMFERDQSHVFTDMNDREKYRSERKMRIKLIKENFDDLMEYSNQIGFPDYGSLKTAKTRLDTCKYWTVKMTLFHVGQTQPALFFQPNVIEIIQKEIDNGNLIKGMLSGAIWEGLGGHKFCTSHREIIESALMSWVLS